MRKRATSGREAAPADEGPGLFDAPPAAIPPEAPAAVIAAGPAAAPPAPPPAWTVSALTARIAGAVGALGRVRVEGEVSELRAPASGHLYFQLKDESARLASVVWRSQAARMRFRPREGDQVVATGRLEVYAPRGSYSLIVDRLEPLGIGALLAQLEELKAELRRLGWLDRKRALPPRPRCIGLVTSRDGAALHDFLRTRSLRWPGYPVRLVHTAVQGPGAAHEIADAIRRAARADVDVVVVCRGGGSLEDLWAFNERAVAEAIFHAAVPVVTGVGHESDVTLADLVADARAHTPTDAAQRLIPERAALCERLDALGRCLDLHLRRMVDERAARLGELRARRVLRDPRWILADRERALDAAAARAERAVSARVRDGAARLAAAHARLERSSPRAMLERAGRRLEAAHARLDRAAERRVDAAAGRLAVLARGLEATSPLAVLARGYAVALGPDGRALTDARAVRPGDVLTTRLSRGSVVSRVESVDPGGAGAPEDPPA